MLTIDKVFQTAENFTGTATPLIVSTYHYYSHKPTHSHDISFYENHFNVVFSKSDKKLIWSADVKESGKNLSKRLQNISDKGNIDINKVVTSHIILGEERWEKHIDTNLINRERLFPLLNEVEFTESDIIYVNKDVAIKENFMREQKLYSVKRDLIKPLYGSHFISDNPIFDMGIHTLEQLQSANEILNFLQK